MKTLDFNEMSKVQGGLEGDDYWTCVAAGTITGAKLGGPLGALAALFISAAVC